MISSTRLLIAAFCVTLLIAAGIYRSNSREAPAAPTPQSAHPVQAQTADLPVPAGTTSPQDLDSKAKENKPGGAKSAEDTAISAFRQWAENAATSSLAQADQTKGMELAKARATAMKTLIQRDPAAALREALTAELRSTLPSQIAATIEQMVQTTGMVSVRMMCNHSPDAPHGNCEATPVLLEEAYSWNAYYGSQPWQNHVGQEVGFEGVAVEGELAVRSITANIEKAKP